MELPPELTRIPFASLDVLRYMGRSGTNSGDAGALATGTGMSERGIGKAIRGLVTKGYLDMDNNYVYYLTAKGSKAIQDIAAYDASNPANAAGGPARHLQAQQQLVAVTPAALASRQPAPVQLGFDSDGEFPGELILRLSAVGGNVTPAQITVNLAEVISTPFNAQVVPDGQHNAVRVRIEAIQMIGDSDVYQAGGMFFDIPVGQGNPNPQAWYGTLSLQNG